MLRDFELRTAITTVLKNGMVAVQVQSFGDGGNLGYFGLHHAYGFRGQPRDANGEGTGAQALVAYEGSRGHAWLCEDSRSLSQLPDEGKGGSLQYAVTAAGKASYVKIAGADGAITAHVDASNGPIRLEHGDSGPSIEVGPVNVEIGGAGGAGAMTDDGSFAAALVALQGALQGAGIAWTAPSGFTSTIVKIKK